MFAQDRQGYQIYLRYAFHYGMFFMHHKILDKNKETAIIVATLQDSKRYSSSNWSPGIFKMLARNIDIFDVTYVTITFLYQQYIIYMTAAF